MKNKLISVIILTYRSFEGIFVTLDSVFCQDYSNIEIIISDDGSPNYKEYAEKIEKYIAENKGENIKEVIYNILPQNGGTVKNINSAIKASNGEYIKVLSADDALSGKEALSKYIAFLEGTEYDICFAKMRGVCPDGSFVYALASCEDNYDLLRKLTPFEVRNKLFARNFLPAPAWCVKRELFEKYGYFLEDTRLIEDYPYWIYLCGRDVRFGYMDDILIDYKLSGISSAGVYGVKFLDDLQIIYDKYIFPNDKRFGIFQFLYNSLKRMGLATYMAKAKWQDYSFLQKVKAYVKYFPFFVYIYLGNKKYEWKNRKIKNEL